MITLINRYYYNHYYYYEIYIYICITIIIINNSIMKTFNQGMRNQKVTTPKTYDTQFGTSQYNCAQGSLGPKSKWNRQTTYKSIYGR